MFLREEDHELHWGRFHIASQPMACSWTSTLARLQEREKLLVYLFLF